MAMEKPFLDTAPPVDGKGDTGPNDGDGPQAPADGEDGGRAPRLPRWTRQEILVLIQGKRVAESRVRRGRAAGMRVGSGQVEPKWATVSSYCKRHGVNRGPVQCRKRWSNLAGDFKKIKEWESQIKEETESFWMMRNDLRRERKLPGFFDREVYDILDSGGASGAGGSSFTSPGLVLALAPSSTVEDVKELANEVMEVEAEAVFDSGRSAAADDGLLSDFENSGQEEVGKSPEKASVPAPIPISEKQYLPFVQRSPCPGVSREKLTASNPNPESTQEGWKQRRIATNENDDMTNIQSQLIETLEKNGRFLGAQMEAQNANIQLDREQRKHHVNSLVAALSKVADALGKIADKL